VDIGARLRTARKAAGLTQEGVARRAGLTLKAVGEVERGEVQDPHYSTLTAIARALGMTVGELVGEELAPLADASETGQTGPIHHVRTPHDSIEVNDEVRAEIRVEKVRAILRALDAGEITAGAADKAVEQEYAAA
jgi:transcriptional regulator with XRE-family HTH domain